MASDEPRGLLICLTCGMLEHLRAVVEANGELPDDHECEFIELPVEVALATAEMFESERKRGIMPRCVDCGNIPVETFHVSSGEGRCRRCARVNWREMWKESTAGLLQDIAEEDPLSNLNITGGRR